MIRHIKPAGMTYERALEIAIDVVGESRIPANSLSAEYRERVEAGVREGVRLDLSDHEVARRLGVPAPTVHYRRTAMGIPSLTQRRAEREASS